MIILKSLLAGYLLASLFTSVSHAFVIERRESPSKTEPGYLVFPTFSRIPGIGTTFGGGVLVNNIAKTRVNAFALAVTGDSDALIFGVNEVHLIKDTLIFNFSGYGSHIPMEMHDRGMSASNDDYLYLVKHEYGGFANVDLQFFERRLQFNSKFELSRVGTQNVRTTDGIGVMNADARESDALATSIGMTLDLTDDDRDPRRGLNFQIVRSENPTFDTLHSRFNVWTGSLTAYIPLPYKSTWAFNAFRSSATVTSENTTSEAELRQKLGLNCNGQTDAGAVARCQQAEDIRVRERLSENKYGTSTGIGGPTQLRGFQLGRFHGSETLFYATELRLNILTEPTKFNLGFMKGSMSFLQVAPFYELGAVSDKPNSIETAPLEAAYGVGVRFGFSGTILRADAGFSREGSQFTFFVGYPWGTVDF